MKITYHAILNPMQFKKKQNLKHKKTKVIHESRSGLIIVLF